MRRTWLSPLAAIALLTLSCGSPGEVPEPGARAAGGGPVAPVAATPQGTGLPRPPGSPASAVASERVEAFASFLRTQPTGLTPAEVTPLARAIVHEARRHGLDPRLVLALMYVESRYRCFAVSPVGAMGLMQILPSTGEELAAELGIPWQGPRTLFDPVVNVRLGVAYLKQLEQRYGSLSTALAAYNWGPGHIDRRLLRGQRLPVVYPSLVLSAYDDARRRHAS